MGYRVMNSNSDFLIAKEHVPRVLDALRVLPEWADADALEPRRLFHCFGLGISHNADGDITDLYLASEHLGDAQEAVFHAIAPFVADASYVMFIGEDAAQWAWVFRKNPKTDTVEAHEEDVIPVLASEYEWLTGTEVST